MFFDMVNKCSLFVLYTIFQFKCLFLFGYNVGEYLFVFFVLFFLVFYFFLIEVLISMIKSALF
ncbi:hypothetical protein BS333_13410 [Vibrio azureus]|nr:hypothetical protein BS333_13410 [Vibrio azureus]